MNHRRPILSIALLAIAAATPAVAQVQPPPTVDSGSADFTTVVGLGDSLMSGECSGSVVETFQIHSVPAQIFRQTRGSLDGFEQALVGEPGMPARLILGPAFSPIPIPLPDGDPLNADLPRPYDNLGISGGYRASDLTTVDGEATCEAINDALVGLGAPPRLGCDRVNLVLRDGGTAVEQALSLDPTFVILWIGGNDVLRAALGGTVVDGITMTPPAAFEAAYRAAVDALTSGGAGLAVANIPNVADLPFVNTVPPVVVDPATREPVLIGGAPVLLLGPGGTPLSPADKVTLFAVTYLGAGCGVPDFIDGGFDAGVCADGFLPQDVILDVAEQGQIAARVAALNAIIEQVAGEYGAAFYDFAATFADITANGVNLGGIEYTADFITGGLVGFDGFHPVPLVAAINANGFIRAINATYGSRIPLVDLYPYVFGNAGNIGPPQGILSLSGETLDRIRSSLMVPPVGSIDVGARRPGRRDPARLRSVPDPQDPARPTLDRRRARAERMR